MNIEEQIRIIVDDNLGDPDDYPNLIADLSKLITKEIKQAKLQELYNYLNDAPAHPPTYVKKRIKKLEQELNKD